MVAPGRNPHRLRRAGARETAFFEEPDRQPVGDQDVRVNGTKSGSDAKLVMKRVTGERGQQSDPRPVPECLAGRNTGRREQALRPASDRSRRRSEIESVQI